MRERVRLLVHFNRFGCVVGVTLSLKFFLFCAQSSPKRVSVPSLVNKECKAENGSTLVSSSNNGGGAIGASAETIRAAQLWGRSRRRHRSAAATTIARRVQDRPPRVSWASLPVIILITHTTPITTTWPLTCPSRKWVCTTPQPRPLPPSTTPALRPCI